MGRKQIRPHGRQSRFADFIKGFLSVHRAGETRQIDVSQPLGREHAVIFAGRLDIDAAPTEIIEELGNGVLLRVVGPDINVKTIVNLRKSAAQNDVLSILGVGDAVGLSGRFHRGVF